MADEERSETKPERSQVSQPSTRRGSNAPSVTNTGPGASQYGSESQTSAATESRRRPQTMSTQNTEGYGSISQSLRDQGILSSPVGPNTPMRLPRRPTGLNRRSTSTHNPHRGQEFSVDDNADEVQEDQAILRPQVQRQRTGTLRRQPSTVRRRPAPQVQPLTEVESDSDKHTPRRGGPAGPTEANSGNAPSSEETLREQEETEQAEPAEAEEEEEGDTTPVEEDEDEEEEEDDGDVSDAESFTLKDRQEAINVTHPFGIRIWKPALYKKDRSVQRKGEEDIHSTPGGHVSNWLLFFNCAWTIIFGWWLALIAFFGSLVCLALGATFDGDIGYGRVLWGLARYLFYPFGKYVKLTADEAYLDEDEGEGRSISEYEQWQSGDIEEGRLFFGPVRPADRSLVGRRRDSADSASETQSLLGRTQRRRRSTSHPKPKRRLFGRGQWTVARVAFFLLFYGLITPSLLLVSAICWLLVFTLPMGRITMLLFDHLRRRPLALEFHSDRTEIRQPGAPSSSLIVCTYRAVGLKYWKYTVDGTNIFLINLLAVVAFTIFDYYVLHKALHVDLFIASNGLVFALALFSIIPLAYFIGQAVASISAQSSMGVGATVNAFFSTVVEVFLYCVALNEGKAQLVEGSIIGSIFAGVLFLPGLSMCFGAIKRKTQRFNVKSAGVTSTMLLFAIIAAFSPTLFYQIYASHELNCQQCSHLQSDGTDCRRCYFDQAPAIYDRFYLEAVRPYTWICAVLLFFSYAIGLFFTLHTHAATIWNTELDEKKAMEQSTQSASHATTRGAPATPFPTLSRQGTRTDVRDSQLYRRILGQSLKTLGVSDTPTPISSETRRKGQASGVESPEAITPHAPPPKTRDDRSGVTSPTGRGIHLSGLSEEDNRMLQRQVAEMAATVATVAARDATKNTRAASQMGVGSNSADNRPGTSSRQASKNDNDGRVTSQTRPNDEIASLSGAGHAQGAMTDSAEAAQGGHDAPNWSRTKSVVILLTATVAYAIIAEILVNTVDAVLDNVDIDEKFLGITLFALVPNTTEFLNAISFAMNGNIALSMEIGSAYALQVCLLQIPCLVLFSGIHGRFIDLTDVVDHTFTLIFPQWDMVTVILCVFLLSYMYGEGKSNYFKGSILILSYLVVVIGFYLSSFSFRDEFVISGVDPLDRLALPPRMKAMGAGNSRRYGKGDEL